MTNALLRLSVSRDAQSAHAALRRHRMYATLTHSERVKSHARLAGLMFVAELAVETVKGKQR